MPHGGTTVPPHIQQQMQRQMQQQMQQQQRQMQQMQKQAHEKYQSDLKQFEQHLAANGMAGASARLPKDPAGFDNWAATQQKRKAQGKSYDPVYDQFRSFAGAASGSGSGSGNGRARMPRRARPRRPPRGRISSMRPMRRR